MRIGTALVMLAAMAAALAGCRDDGARQPSAQAPNKSGDTSRHQPPVPLRVWFVSDSAGQQFIERQWQANSERPLALHMLTPEGLAETTRCEADVLVFPAHMLGEIIARQYLVELPASLQSKSPSLATAPLAPGSEPGQANADEEPAPPTVQPGAWIDQTRYGKRLWGISLGVTTPVILFNFSAPTALTELSTSSEASDAGVDSKAFWQSLIEALSAEAQKGSQPQSAADSPASDGDEDALCDRFLVVLTSISQRESRFGALLDPESLQSRLGGAEFVEAGKILLQLHKANASPQALLGSPADAWEALANAQPNVSIGLPPGASPEVDKVTTIRASLPPPAPVQSAARTPRGWNSGHGLVVGLTSECRQTSQAIEFMRWLSSDASRSALAKRFVGAAREAAYAPGSSAWQAQRLAGRLAGQPRVFDEPRLPGSLEYRRALGKELAGMLRGEQSPEEAMKAAAAAWDQITATRDRAALQRSYEQSLGL